MCSWRLGCRYGDCDFMWEVRPLQTGGTWTQTWKMRTQTTKIWGKNVLDRGHIMSNTPGAARAMGPPGMEWKPACLVGWWRSRHELMVPGSMRHGKEALEWAWDKIIFTPLRSSLRPWTTTHRWISYILLRQRGGTQSPVFQWWLWASQNSKASVFWISPGHTLHSLVQRLGREAGALLYCLPTRGSQAHLLKRAHSPAHQKSTRAV